MLKMLRTFRDAASGMAAVEFALIAPIMIALFFGLVEVCNILDAQQKVTSVASTAADLVGQSTTLTQSNLDDVFSASSAIMTPFSSVDTKIVLTSLAGTGVKNTGTVLWSKSNVKGADVHSVGSKIAIGTTTADASLDPSLDGLLPKTCSGASQCGIIMAEVSYDYTSPYGKFIIGTRTLTDSFYVKPRRVTSVPCTDCGG